MAKAAQSTARGTGKSNRAANTSKKNTAPKLNTGFFSVVMIAITLVLLIMLIWPSDEYSPLHTLKGFLCGLVGSLSWTLPVVFALSGYFAYRSNGDKSLLIKFLVNIFSLYFLFLTMVEAFYVDSIAAGMGISSSYVNFLSFAFRARTGGGLFGALLAWPLHSFMGRWGALILCVFATALILFGTGVFSLERLIRQFSGESDEETEEKAAPAKQPRPAKAPARMPEKKPVSHKQPQPARRESAPPAAKRPSPTRKAPAEDVFEVSSARPPKKTGRIYDEPFLDDYSMNTAAPVRLPNLKNGEKPKRTVVKNNEDGFEIPRVFEDKTDPYSEFIDRPAKKKKKRPAAPSESEQPAPRKKTAPKIEKIDLMEAVRMESAEDRNRKYVNSALSDHSKKPKPVLGYSTPSSKTEPLSTRSKKDNTVLSENSPELDYFFSDEPKKPVRPAKAEDTKSEAKAEPKAPADTYKAPAAPIETKKEPPAPKPSFFDAPAPEKKAEYVPQTKLAGMREIEKDKEYDYPPIDLMETGGAVTSKDSYEAGDMQRAEKLVETLRSFSVPVKITGISHGPAVTRFELLPAPGIKVSKIASYADDIAMNLAAESVRIEAPIPGKSAVGVELPNTKKEMVHLRDVLESNEAQKAASRLAVALGKDNSGKYIVADLASMPHVLIAGQTGSGKSVCINAIIISILYRSTPEEVRMIMIDPKMVELNAYNTIPHLLVPVVTDPKKAASALDWAVSEMTRRYKEFANHGAKNIQSYNKRLPAGEKPMPQIVIIVDELADLMMTAPHDVEEAINRLAQLARAAGMHLVIATQRPSVNVITGVIKANIPTRIAFTVASGVDSRTILDSYGAESLLGKGDMLYLPPDRNKPLRIQGAWVSEEEVQAVVDYVSTGTDTNFDEDILEHMENAVLSDAEKADKQKEESDDQVDELFAVAVKAVIDNGQASISMLQRKLRVGYARAGRLIDDMAQRGFVSQSEGSKSREVLITREQYLELFGDSAE